MTMRLLGAAGAIAVAMALEPASYRPATPEQAGGSAQSATSTDDAPPSVKEDLPVIARVEPRVRAATLSIVPVPRNPRVVARLKAMLPPGVGVQEAATGFQNQAQFIAAVQVSHNLDIPFARMKAKVVDEGLSLGQAILALRPGADVSRELARARDLVTQ